MEAAADDKAIDAGDPACHGEHARRAAQAARFAAARRRGQRRARRCCRGFRIPPTNCARLRSRSKRILRRCCSLASRRMSARSRSTDLSRYKVIVFATHGLVPGELNGLTQPALALSRARRFGLGGRRPSHHGGDPGAPARRRLGGAVGLQHRLRRGAGAEAASGLGRAFFYAGTRALLVTNWSVHSQSARDLTTDLFRRQNADPEAVARRGSCGRR